MIGRVAVPGMIVRVGMVVIVVVGHGACDNRCGAVWYG
jgi:hypothetical protein